jgi:hypothetical protein
MVLKFAGKDKKNDNTSVVSGNSTLGDLDEDELMKRVQ